MAYPVSCNISLLIGMPCSMSFPMWPQRPLSVRLVPVSVTCVTRVVSRFEVSAFIGVDNWCRQITLDSYYAPQVQSSHIYEAPNDLLKPMNASCMAPLLFLLISGIVVSVTFAQTSGMPKMPLTATTENCRKACEQPSGSPSWDYLQLVRQDFPHDAAPPAHT